MSTAPAEPDLLEDSRDGAAASGDSAAPSLGRRALAVLLILGIWLAVRLVCWTGFAGADDLIYSRYAHTFHRLPMNHMEFRMPVVLSLRTAMAAFGPSEAAICLAPLAYSALLLLSVAWFVGWPRELSWRTNGSMLLASLIPIDVGFATYPSPAEISSMMGGLGTVCLLRGGWKWGILGGAILGFGFMAHHLNFFFVALLCLTALAIDWRTYWRGVLACFVLSCAMLFTEMAVYAYLAGNPLLHFDSYSTLQGGIPEDTRADSKLEFFLMPLQILILSKPFGFGLLALLVCGALAYKKFSRPQRIVWIATLGFWFWLGYGTVTPFDYRPATRGMHYYTPLVFGLCALLPAALELVFARRKAIAHGVLVALWLVFVASLGLGGAWGSQVEVSGELLKYAKAHPQQRFLTDVYTLNEMYCLNAFELPDNVVVLDSNPQQHHLLVNKEPAGVEKLFFERPTEVDGLLINLSRVERPAEDEFLAFQQARQGEVVYQIPPRLRLAFVPLARWLGERSFARRDQGGEVRRLAPATAATKDNGVATDNGAANGDSAASDMR